jgi:hypothetical protein
MRMTFTINVDFKYRLIERSKGAGAKDREAEFDDALERKF